MKKRLLIGAILAAVLLAAFSWFHVSGREIDLVEELDKNCTVTVRVYGWPDGSSTAEEHTLTAAQTGQLRELLLATSFRRNPANTLTWQSEGEEQQYDILADFHDGQHFLILHLLGNHHLSVVNQFGGDFLMLRKSADFEQRLLDILGQT